jgi:hypothetical protein
MAHVTTGDGAKNPNYATKSEMIADVVRTIQEHTDPYSVAKRILHTDLDLLADKSTTSAVSLGLPWL